MEPISGVVPTQYNVVTPASLEFLPVASTADSEAIDFNLDKEGKKASAFQKSKPFTKNELPNELKMSFHQELKRLMVRIVDAQGDTVRELPPEKYLDLVASIMKQQTTREEAREEYLSHLREVQSAHAARSSIRNGVRGLKGI